ncbi:RNA-directed DNA polymerase, eukaryota [Tanacetum coccineum]
MACSLPHTDYEVEALVQKLIDEDKVRQNAILDLALQLENACTAKDDLRKTYEKWNDIPQESRALIDTFLKEGSDKDYELNLSILDIDDSDLHLTPVLRSSSSTRVKPSPSTLNPVRIIPSPAGIVQQAKLLKERDILLGWDGAVMRHRQYLKKGKLDQVVAIVKSCSPTVLDDLTVTMKDLHGIIPGTIHYKVIGEGAYGKDITVGAAMILANVLIFSPKPSMHYPNITKRNVVKVFRKDTVLRSGCGYLTKKEQQQLALDEEALREMLKEEARAEKERERAEKE